MFISHVILYYVYKTQLSVIKTGTDRYSVTCDLVFFLNKCSSAASICSLARSLSLSLSFSLSLSISLSLFVYYSVFLLHTANPVLHVLSSEILRSALE